SYHVGVYGFSVWLTGLTVIVMAAAIAYGFWAGRERLRAYLGLMLFLTGAVVGVFTAQDLLLFYAFFEAMMIPLYVLVGVWGGRDPLGGRVEGCGVRLPPHRDHQVPGARPALSRADPGTRRDRTDLRIAARIPRARHPRRDRVLVARADGTDHDGRLLRERSRAGRLGPADGQPRTGLGDARPAGRDGRTT